MEGSLQRSAVERPSILTPYPGDNLMTEKKKREWVYLMAPKDYEMAGCDCGNLDVQWSEWQGMLWCDRCQKDFVPADSGLFDGPIGVNLCALMGITFDRLNLATHAVERFDLETGKYVPAVEVQTPAPEESKS